MTRHKFSQIFFLSAAIFIHSWERMWQLTCWAWQYIWTKVDFPCKQDWIVKIDILIFEVRNSSIWPGQIQLPIFEYWRNTAWVWAKGFGDKLKCIQNANGPTHLSDTAALVQPCNMQPAYAITDLRYGISRLGYNRYQYLIMDARFRLLWDIKTT